MSNMLPGAAPSPCTLKATYSGTLPAYLGIDVLIESQAGSGGTKLYNPTDGSNDLQISITDNLGTSTTYLVPTISTGCPGSAPANSTCYGLNDELVRLTPVPANTVVIFSTAVTLPTGSTTGYQGGAAQIILMAHAAQSANNGSTGSCTAGHPCPSVSWS